ncbi:MAG: hypothetical protein AAGC71_05450 [Pseudomonadota bacterium]
MHPITVVIVRYTANVTMFMGLVVALLAAWDYVHGPGAGQADTLWLGLIGVAVFIAGFRGFRRLAKQLEADQQPPTTNH